MTYNELIKWRDSVRKYHYQEKAMISMANKWSDKERYVGLLKTILQQPNGRFKITNGLRLYYSKDTLKDHPKRKKSILSFDHKHKKVYFHNPRGKGQVKCMIRTLTFNALINKGYTFYNRMD
jgi:hypothetical protein